MHTVSVRVVCVCVSMPRSEGECLGDWCDPEICPGECHMGEVPGSQILRLFCI